MNIIDSCGDRQCGACQGLAPRLSGDGRPVRQEVIRRYLMKLRRSTSSKTLVHFLDLLKRLDIFYRVYATSRLV